MVTSIQLYNEFFLDTDKICNKDIYYMLSSEGTPQRLTPNILPQDSLCHSRILPVILGKIPKQGIEPRIRCAIRKAHADIVISSSSPLGGIRGGL